MKQCHLRFRRTNEREEHHRMGMDLISLFCVGECNEDTTETTRTSYRTHSITAFALYTSLGYSTPK